MYAAKLVVLVLAVYLQSEAVFGQRQWVDPATTAQEMRYPGTWYRPYYQAAAEAYANFYQKAAEIREQLNNQAYATGTASRPNGSGSYPSRYWG